MSPSERSGDAARQLAGPADASKATSSVELLAKIEQLAAAVERLQIRPALVIGKRAHPRDPEESTALPAMWAPSVDGTTEGPTSQGETSLVRTSVGSAFRREAGVAVRRLTQRTVARRLRLHRARIRSEAARAH
eukprot:s8207_g4.t1